MSYHNFIIMSYTVFCSLVPICGTYELEKKLCYITSKVAWDTGT